MSITITGLETQLLLVNYKIKANKTKIMVLVWIFILVLSFYQKHCH